MLRTNDSKSGTRSYALGNFRTLLLISHAYKTLCFSFEAFRAIQLIQQIAATSKGLLFLYTLVSSVHVFASDMFDLNGASVLFIL